ncbi:spindle and kinetochore-associated protein 3 [Hippocampus zosterae]|uniref:spindle and kinetochore-associated protein 3 n=1 Tax=Hippocampus zosterae TaxID=109293 RepID=UPI00223E5463|nr:spindle and kinetochore-associated protein 3 [Hippocampus zosterae]
MDLKSEFFAKLKKLCQTLETETAQLQQTFNYRHDNTDCEAAAKGMRVCHDVNCDVLGLKGQLQDELSKQKAHKTDTDSFIHACRAMQSKVAHDVRELTAHFEDYGDQNSTDGCPSHAEDATMEEESADNEEEEEDDNEHTEQEEEVEEEEEVAEDCSNLPTSPLAAVPADPLSTPKLSDFGLCELYLHQRFSECGQQPTMPELSLPRRDVPTPLPPTPRCALRMDEDELRTPQMRDLGLSEDTMCFNDFTMELFKKTADKRQAQDPQALPVPALTESLQEEENVKSPEPPVFCTPGFKIKKTNGHRSPPSRMPEGDAPSPSAADQLPLTPKVPAFQTPSLKRLLGSKTREPPVAESKDSRSMPLLETPRDGSVVGRRAWEYDVPELRIPGVQESADLDEATPDFHLSPPRATRDIYEISTPEMPDLSSITQDICKLVLQSQKPPKKERKSRCMNAVSKQEFHSLPAWLKQITLNNLNRAVHNINQYLVQCPGEDTREFGMEELKKITDAGIKAPVYLLCLSELRRLEHVEGVRNSAIYKLNLCS